MNRLTEISGFSFLFLVFFTFVESNAQAPFINNKLEKYSENISDLSITDEQTTEGVQELMDNYLWLSSRKIRLDEEGLKQLVLLQLINEEEAWSIRSYFYKYGKMYTLYELAYIEGISTERAKELANIIEGSGEGYDDISVPGKEKLFINQELILRYRAILPESQGYSRVYDTITGIKVYNGHPAGILVKYRFNAGRFATAGFTLENDPGEVVTLPHARIKQRSIQSGFDYQSAYLEIRDLGFLRTFILGDYQVRIGQGLNFWSGLSFNYLSGSRIYRTSIPLKPYTSTYEAGYLRGAASHISFKIFDLVMYASRKKFDATDALDPLDSTYYIRNFRNSGYHRTPSERLKKHNYKRSVAGAVVNLNTKFLKAYISGLYEEFNAPLIMNEKIENIFRFKGRAYFLFGAGLVFRFNRTLFTSEISLNKDLSHAFTTGLIHTIADHFAIALEYRRRTGSYVNFHTSGNFRTSVGTPEEGIYIGTNLELLPGLQLISSLNYSRIKWIRNSVKRPSSEVMAMIQSSFTTGDLLLLEMRYSFFYGPDKGEPIFSHMPQYFMHQRHKLKFSLRLDITESLALRPSISYNLISPDNSESTDGTAVSLDLLYNPVKMPLSLRLRLASFNTTDYDSRVYLYEHDVYGSASMPAYHGLGHRAYLTGRYSLTRFLDIWIKAGVFYYLNAGSVGSGYDLIEGNRKYELKGQARLRF